jgi:class 3 adenylate cyclase
VAHNTDVPAELAAVLEAHLGAPRTSLANWPLGRMRAVLQRSTRSPQHDLVREEVGDLLSLIGIEGSDHHRLTARVADMLDPQNGIDLDALPTLMQAYSRAVGRIVHAEAGVIRDALSRAPEADRPGLLADALEAILPVGAQGFEALHRTALGEALSEVLHPEHLAPGPFTPTAVAMVDLVGSTQYLADGGEGGVSLLVDALFEAGQRATAGRDAHLVKHVGDGLFLAGHDVPAVAEAALDVLERLEADRLPLQARGGLAHGRVLERAGDLFGLPVNAAQLVSKAARPGMLLALEDAAVHLPPAMRGRLREVAIPHPALGEQRVATVKRP